MTALPRSAAGRSCARRLSPPTPSAPRSATSTRSGSEAKLVSPSSDVKTAPPMRAAPQSAVRIVPANHCTETRRRSTKPLVPPSTDSGGSLPSSMASACLDRYAPRDRVWSKLAVPCASDRRWLAATKLAPAAVGRPRKSMAGTMPVGPWPVNDGPRTRLIGLKTVAECPRCDSIPRKDPKDDPGIWPECGAIWFKASVSGERGILGRASPAIPLWTNKMGVFG